jgi:hypothetical protein
VAQRHAAATSHRPSVNFRKPIVISLNTPILYTACRPASRHQRLEVADIITGLFDARCGERRIGH